MDAFSILTNRKRAIVALVHSAIFLAIAIRQMIEASPATGLWVTPVSTSTWVLCGIFTIVSSILLWLYLVSRGQMEKGYFGLCIVSAPRGCFEPASEIRRFMPGSTSES